MKMPPGLCLAAFFIGRRKAAATTRADGSTWIPARVSAAVALPAQSCTSPGQIRDIPHHSLHKPPDLTRIIAQRQHTIRILTIHPALFRYYSWQIHQFSATISA
jgi:hypothetical protein